jgi:uncharacterized protein (DUF924 family)
MDIPPDLPTEALAVLDTWFGPDIVAGRGAPRPEWFRKDPAFDAGLRERFGALVARAQAGELAGWTGTPAGTLALIVVLDQFSRNIHRCSPSSFAGDARALALARGLMEAGLDRTLPPVARMFVYLPFEHSETLSDQDIAVERMGALGREDARLADLGEWAEKHRVVIRRFGRFPHRNAALGRASTPEEEAFLREPGSSF